MKHSVTGCIHYEVDDQIGGTLLVEVALNLSQAHLTPARGAGPRASPWEDGILFLLTTEYVLHTYYAPTLNALNVLTVLALLTFLKTPQGRY